MLMLLNQVEPRLNPLGASVITLDNDTVRRWSSFNRRHLSIPAGMISMGEVNLEHIRPPGKRDPVPHPPPSAPGHSCFAGGGQRPPAGPTRPGMRSGEGAGRAPGRTPGGSAARWRSGGRPASGPAREGQIEPGGQNLQGISAEGQSRYWVGQGC